MKINKVKKIEWIKSVTRPMFLYAQIPQTVGERDFLTRKVGAGFKNKILLPTEGGHIQHFGEEDWNNLALAIKRKLEKEENWLRKYAKEIQEICEDFLKYLKSISTINLSLKSNEKLFKYYQKFVDFKAKFAYVLYPPLVIEGILEEKVKNELERELKGKGKESLFDEYLSIITTKTLLNESDEEEIELLKIAQEFEEEGRIYDKKIDDKLQKHAEKYVWLPYYGYGFPLGDKEYFKRQLEQAKNPKQRLIERKEKCEIQKESIEKIRREFKGTLLEEFIKIIQTYLYLRPYRTEVLRKSYYYPIPLLKEIANRMKIKLDDVMFLIPDEIENFFKKGVKPGGDKVEERKKHYAIVMIDGTIDIISDREEIERLKEMFIIKEKIEAEILRGNTAYPGLIKGKVRILGSIKDVGKLQRGEILVTSMTTPDMTLAIHKAAAIVTDEGGITCHAAICSRELKIPCVIATKIATKVLEDGDKIEVNADEGIVKILEKAK